MARSVLAQKQDKPASLAESGPTRNEVHPTHSRQIGKLKVLVACLFDPPPPGLFATRTGF